MMKCSEAIIGDLIELRQEGQSAALVTLIGNKGSSPRPLGSQMLVAEDGRYEGYLTGGCAESVIVSEAIAAMTERTNRVLRLGPGSPYMDIRLPCGAAIELHIDVGITDAMASGVTESLGARLPLALDTELDGRRHHWATSPPAVLPENSFRRWYLPPRRLLIAGKGPNAPALANLAVASDYEVMVMSPDPATLDACSGPGVEVCRLAHPETFLCPATDPWTAAVLLFHEHEWESRILAQLLTSECFYLGALGSQKTHSQRVEQLSEMGFDKEVARLHGPVGLDINAKTPAEIAISILAEMTQAYRSTAQPLFQRSPD
ncbi:MAG: XdhC family protein [Oleiphilaceae bacterium]|nr:XdhC family protein [Oleiphilaceae bacterium]